ncbi:HGL114Cp [Eremothecium sinecaudum]|uniref:HGL114Cp n=1 Tax=Eremothecium sinecaudum TaxID=45286 RepID=A0A0X8HUZ0_9SACH|nr:HGL114Cp [Eremothecium sinecaudum]AMD22226.1 HGL114Cp [Eremothecium sinecaudum]
MSAKYYNSVRKLMLTKCLNREFDELLKLVKDTDVRHFNTHFLQIYLSRAVQEGHTESAKYIFNKFVLRHKFMIVRPNVLCQLANLVYYDGKTSFLDSLWRSYLMYFRNLSGPDWDRTKYHLLKLRIESFARCDVSFQKKWIKLLETMDEVIPNQPLSVWDFPNMTSSLKTYHAGALHNMLFDKFANIATNDQAIVLLLDMILLQTHVDEQFKLQLFQRFVQEAQYDKEKSLNNSITILLYQLSPEKCKRLIEYLVSKQIAISPKNGRLYQSKFQDVALAN